MGNPQYLTFTLKKLSIEELLAELEFPFPVDHIFWKLTDTAATRFQTKESNFAVKSPIASGLPPCTPTAFSRKPKRLAWTNSSPSPDLPTFILGDINAGGAVSPGVNWALDRDLKPCCRSPASFELPKPQPSPQ